MQSRLSRDEYTGSMRLQIAAQSVSICDFSSSAGWIERQTFFMVRYQYLNMLRNFNKYFLHTLKELQRLVDSQKYEQVLGVTRRSSRAQIQSKYLQMVKKYHPDKNMMNSETVRKENEKKMQIYNVAYQKILSNLKIASQQSESSAKPMRQPQPEPQRTKYSKPQWQRTDKQRIHLKIFGQYREDIDSFEYYSKKNEQLRKRYQQELQRLEKNKKKSYGQQTQKSQQKRNTEQKPKASNRSQYQQSEFTQRHQQETQKTDSNVNTIVYSDKIFIAGLIGAFVACILVGIRINFKVVKKSQQERKIVPVIVKSKQDIDRKHQQAVQNYHAQRKMLAQSLIQSFVSERPLMLSYPTKQDPVVEVQLLKYTIYKDIELREANPDDFYTRQFQDKPFTHGFQFYGVKPNTLVTLSLQAERCLQNIYVTRTEVIRQIKKYGKYTPPGVFFRFYGFIHVTIRDKPLTLQNYDGREWISLFDLFFKYYSPIFFKKDVWNEYRARGVNFGNVRINSRPLTRVYLTKHQHNVYMWQKKKQESNFVDETSYYDTIWGGYYHRIRDKFD